MLLNGKDYLSLHSKPENFQRNFIKSHCTKVISGALCNGFFTFIYFIMKEKRELNWLDQLEIDHQKQTLKRSEQVEFGIDIDTMEVFELSQKITGQLSDRFVFKVKDKKYSIVKFFDIEHLGLSYYFLKSI